MASFSIVAGPANQLGAHAAQLFINLGRSVDSGAQLADDAARGSLVGRSASSPGSAAQLTGQLNNAHQAGVALLGMLPTTTSAHDNLRRGVALIAKAAKHSEAGLPPAWSASVHSIQRDAIAAVRAEGTSASARAATAFQRIDDARAAIPGAVEHNLGHPNPIFAADDTARITKALTDVSEKLGNYHRGVADQAASLAETVNAGIVPHGFDAQLERLQSQLVSAIGRVAD